MYLELIQAVHWVHVLAVTRYGVDWFNQKEKNKTGKVFLIDLNYLSVNAQCPSSHTERECLEYVEYSFRNARADP